MRDVIAETERVADFLEAVRANIEGLSVAVGCAENCCCVDDDESHDLCSESSFSWSSCDTCGSKLGGSRHDAHGLPVDENGHLEATDEIIHLDICVDCLMYFANGDLPEDWRAS